MKRCSRLRGTRPRQTCAGEPQENPPGPTTGRGQSRWGDSALTFGISARIDAIRLPLPDPGQHRKAVRREAPAPLSAAPKARVPGPVPPGRVPSGAILTGHADGPAVGALWAGCGDLELAAADILGGRIAWVSGGHGAAQLAARFPGITGLGEVSTAADWAMVPRTDVITVGFPCRFGCHAGARPGDTCGWVPVPEAVRALRPGLAFVENSARGLPRALADLTALGYSTRWARHWHPRDGERIFILALQPAAPGRVPDSGRPQQRRTSCPAVRPPARRGSTRPLARHSEFVDPGAGTAAHPRINRCRNTGLTGVPAILPGANHTASCRRPLRQAPSRPGPGDHGPLEPAHATGRAFRAAARDPGSESARDQAAAVLRLLLESAAWFPSRLDAASECDRGVPRTTRAHPGWTCRGLVTPACCIGGCHGRPV